MDATKLDELGKKYLPFLTEENIGSGWMDWLNESPSRLFKLYNAIIFSRHHKSLQDKTYDLEDETDQMAIDHNLVQGLLNKEDWEYNKTYCKDGRYKRWCSEMQAKAPDTRPEGWD